ncbi:Prion-like-(Q/N-rich)-domain-bearing protein [Caenorhabditis elegans]|uniref:Prion-like-(Q/N-rich)-domain-bearing protein n=1 Tax=Caenorhabditis elegans TaxID=6239 RepID=A0A5E4LZL1_CAEEL|nr:Prion-like-(Q/N-rich)-domain-bearing protein [Caenorhabditis elegans]VVC12389.1 Prion-like-(Q/N-rich)-domain-bearing protein [Caenorhabditis elegans]
MNNQEDSSVVADESAEVQKPSPELHPGTGQSSLRNFIRLDMPLGQALQEVPLGAVAGQLRVQKALYEKMDGMNGIAPESASTSGQTFMQDPAPPLPPKKAAPKRKKPTKAEIEAAGGNVSSVEKPKKPRAPSKKKAQGTVQQEHQMISMTSAHQGQTEFHQPSHQSTHQPLPSVANLLPPLTGYQQQQQQQQRPPSQQHHNGVVNNNTTTNGYGYSDVSGNGGSSSSSSSVYSSYSYSMQPTSDPPKKHQSLASMLTPITFGSSQPEATNTGSSQIYTDKNQYHLYNDNNTYPHQPAMYSNQTSSNGYYGGYEDVSNNQFQQPDYPPLSVESQVSCHSQESNITYHSSMPVTPISQQANNGSLYNPMPVTKDNRFSNSSSHIQQDHEDLSVEQFAQKYAFPSDNFFEMQNSRDSQETNSAPLSMARASNASPFDELGIYLDSGPSTSHTQDDPFADIELSDPPLSITPQVAQEPVQTTIMSNRVIKTPSSETHPQSYANVQYVPMNPSLPVSSHSESQVRSTKKLPSNFKEDDIRHSTCPDNCNKCVSEKSNADISMQPSPASTIVTVPQSQRMDQHLEQQRGVEQLAATDDEQICYVKYLPHEISHTNLGRPRQQSKPSGVGVNGTSHGLTNQGPPPLPPPKRSRAKPKKKNAFEQDMNASSSGHAYQMQNSPEVSIGKLLKQQHLNRPNQFNNISGQSQIDLATLQQSVMLSPKLQRYSEPQTMQKFSHHQKEAQVHEKKNHMQQGSAKQEPIQHRQVNLQQVPTQQSSGPAHQSTIHYAPMKQQIKLTSLQSNKTSQEHQSTTLQAPVEEAPSDQFPENFLEQPDSPDKVTEVINNVVASVLSSPDEFRGQKQFTKTEKHLLDGTSKPTPKKQSHVDRRSRGSFVHYVQGKQQMISQQQNRNAYQVQQQQQPNASSLSTMNEQYEVVLDNTNLQNPMSEQQVQMNYQTSIVQQTSVEQQGPLQLQNQIQVTNQQTHRVQYQHHPVQHNQRNGPTKAAPRKRTPKPAPVQSRSVALHERAQMIVDFAKTQPADQEDQTVQLQDHEHQYNSQQQPEYQHQPLVQMQEQSNEQQSQVFQHQHQHQAQQELAENQGSMGMATQQQQCRQSQLQQQLQQPPQQQMQIQQQYQNVGPSHIQRQNVAPQRVQQQPMQYAQQQQQPMMQMAQQRSMQEQYVQQGQVQRTGATHTVLMTSPPMNHHESQANVLRVAPKQTIVKSADPKPEDEAKILKILKDKLASDDGQNAPKMSPVLRVKHIRETINIIAALPSLTIEELFDKADTPPPDEYMEEYMDFYDKITHLMKDEPCVPEINVEDVLSTPLLEPALHGRFRKRLIAIREGRTTVTTFKKRKTASGPEGDAKKRKPTNNHTNGMHTPDASPAQGTSSGQSSSSGMQSQSLSITTGMSSSSSSPPASDFDISTHLITPPQEHSSPLTTPPIINHEYVQQVSSPVDIFSQPSTSEPGPSSRPIRTGVHHREEALNEDDNGSPILYDDPIMGYVGTNRFVSLDMDDMIDDVMKSDDTEEMLVHNLQRSIFDVGKSFEDDDEDDTNVIKLDTNTDNHRPATPSVGILDDLNSVLFDPIMM